MAITRRTRPTFRLTNHVPVTVIRKEKDEIVKGRPIAGSSVEVVIEANVQPMQYRDLLQLPESDRTKEWIVIYTTDLIRTAREGSDGWDADTVVWNGDHYRVMRLKQYQMGVLDHTEALAARVPISAK